MSGLGDLALLRIEIETLWPSDDRGRIQGRDFVIASSSSGLAPAIGTAVPDDLAAELVRAVSSAPAPGDSSAPPPVLEHCRTLLERTLGTVELRSSSGPSYLITDAVAFESEVPLITSAAPGRRPANPGNWSPAEWEQLLDGALGPWVMATHHDEVISICHTPVSNAQAAEAGVWTKPEFRGQGHAAAVTAAWASLMRPSGRHLFYSTGRTNLSSQRVAARLGLRPIGWLWQLVRLD
jgi:RimJ/RimL family protein N-acetyltransferase